MESALKWASAEQSASKIAGVYSGEQEARNAAQRLRAAGLAGWQVRLLSPAYAHTSMRGRLGRHIEPEVRGLFRTLVKTHVILGAVGLILGLLLFAALRGHPAVDGSPLYAFGSIVFFSLIAGLLAGGLIALRPDHSRLMSDVRRALSQRNWVVVTHPRSQQQIAAVAAIVENTSIQTFRTL